MKRIGGFFEKFKGVALKELHKREMIQISIKKITKQDIEIKDIGIREGVITIKGNQGLKSEIFLKKKVILDLISKNTSITFSEIK